MRIIILFFRNCSHTNVYVFLYTTFIVYNYICISKLLCLYVKRFELRMETALYKNKYIIIIIIIMQ